MGIMIRRYRNNTATFWMQLKFLAWDFFKEHYQLDYTEVGLQELCTTLQISKLDEGYNSTPALPSVTHANRKQHTKTSV